MLKMVTTGILTFVSTNIDDLFILTILFSQVNSKLKKSDIVIGQYLSLGLLTLVSIIIAFGLNVIAVDKLSYLGIIPIFLGIKSWIDYLNQKKENEEDISSSETLFKENSYFSNKWISSPIISVMLIGLASGADNIGVYVPLFSSFDAIQLMVTVIIFAIMLIFWCYLGEVISNFPVIKSKLADYQHVVVPIVYILLGCYILFG